LILCPKWVTNPDYNPSKMPHVVLRCPIVNSFRVQQVASLYDVPVGKQSEFRVEYETPPDDFQIGAIIGKSGTGKTSIANALYPKELYRGAHWEPHKAVIDSFGDFSAKQIIETLTLVGFSSPPHWLKPYSVLSNGEQFRCNLARALLQGGTVVFDEYTSVVDRNVAKIASLALAKALRGTSTIRAGRIKCRFIAVSCHFDILEWLTPDWVLSTDTGKCEKVLLRRPPIAITIRKAERAEWRYFRNYHYLNTAELSPFSQCYIAMIDGERVGFASVLHVTGKAENTKRISRLVVLPDYQGVGVGKALLNAIAQHLKKCYNVTITTRHPAMIASLLQDNRWFCKGAFSIRDKRTHKSDSIGKKSVSFSFR